ncbi:hypothetical protein [Phytohabitans houttuyneae]|uniref:Uncharacterized protein n=1 Tax=Phytohabitans houttuyneae TaxID=1076126 RepID=A0A6V8KF54_9ACTN|nr:hypothetical protein [Phytohabitans houttuyneae]GFJ80988.1 hypothetical protein Phou_051680 [Phytohabitans houttuyneae]
MEPTTATATRRLDWRRRMALLLAALVACLGSVTVAAPSPAQASSTSLTFCFPIYHHVWGGWYIVKWYCMDIPVEYDPNPCCLTDFAIDFAVNPALPEDLQHGYLEQTGRGISLLVQAAGADPRTAAALRAQAQESFLAAARVLGDAKVTLRQVGIADRQNNRVEPMPYPWLEAAGVDIADGLGLMQRALTERAPLPWIKEGMAEFEKAAAGLTAPPARG